MDKTMSTNFRGKRYRSKKHPILEYIFEVKTKGGTQGIGEDHDFTLQDISQAMNALFDDLGYRPTSHSNFVLDLTRKNAKIESRLPTSIIELGYDLRKKTGPAPHGEKYAGTFVYVGIGGTIDTWLVWPDEPGEVYTLDNRVPAVILPHLAKDEGALFSVIDYCDVLSQVIYGVRGSVLRVQNPLKWQPNEIDGLSYSDASEVETLFPIEAKALSTRDDINLEQMNGAYRTLRLRKPHIRIVPLGIRMIVNGMDIAVFRGMEDHIELERTIRVYFDPVLEPWT